MATVWPSVPTDSLYKFVAIFGLVLVAFGLWVPEKFAAADAARREAHKTRQLASVRVDRKKVQVDRIVEEFNAKSADVRTRLKKSQDDVAALQKRRDMLADELVKLKANPTSGGAKDITGRTETARSEVRAVEDQIHRGVEEVRKLGEEYKPIQLQQEEVLDELKAENIELKSDNEAAEDLIDQARWWFVLMVGSLVAGVLMIGLGFRLWYAKVQIFQDMILKREATSQDSEPGSGD